MHAYLDESGDTGFKCKHNSSNYLVVALVLVAHPDPLSEAMDTVRRQLGKHPLQEMKFIRLAHEERLIALRTLCDTPFSVRTVVVDKRKIRDPTLQKPASLYRFVVTEALASSAHLLEDAFVTIDESFKSRTQQLDLTSHVRQEVNQRGEGRVQRIRSVSYADSSRHSLLQVADLMVGAVARSYEKNDSSYRLLIRRRLYVRELPEGIESPQG